MICEISDERLAQCFGILEAMTNASTRFHADSTRALVRFSLGFDKAAALRAARIQANLLESSRIMRRKNGKALLFGKIQTFF